MAILGKELYKFASSLYQSTEFDNQDEATRRAIINRAYYGAFIEAREKANLSSESAGVHKDTISYYHAQRTQISVRISNRLKSLFKSRKKADYDVSSNIDRQQMQKSLRDSKNILQDLGIADLD